MVFGNCTFGIFFEEKTRDKYKKNLQYVSVLGTLELKRSSFMCCGQLIDIPGRVVCAKDMSLTFAYCKSFIGSETSGWDVSEVTNMSGMFLGCKSFNQPIGGWGV